MLFSIAVLALLASVQGRAVNISNTWVLPEEGFPVFYRYFRDRISWYEADAVCQFHHANLVTGDILEILELLFGVEGKRFCVLRAESFYVSISRGPLGIIDSDPAKTPITADGAPDLPDSYVTNERTYR